MYLLDADVIREMWLPQPNPLVLDWKDSVREDSIAIPVPVIAELFAAIELRPDSLEKVRLQKQVDDLAANFSKSFIPFDLPAARIYGVLLTLARRRGITAATIDLEISAIALLHRATVVTLNPTVYVGLGVDILDPATSPTNT